MPLHVDPYRKTIMVDFHVLIDTDLGAALYLQRHTKNKRFFEKHIPDANVYYLQYMALTRKEYNPIEYMFLNEYKGNADKIYTELMNEKWDQVVNQSPITDILKIFVTSYKRGGYKFTVNCRNQAEVDKMNLLTKEWNAEIQVKSVEPFFCLYLHDIMSIIDNDYDVKGKSIYLYNYSKNHPNDEMTDMTAIHPIALRWKNTTDFSFISPYINFQIPVG